MVLRQQAGCLRDRYQGAGRQHGTCNQAAHGQFTVNHQVHAQHHDRNGNKLLYAGGAVVDRVSQQAQFTADFRQEMRAMLPLALHLSFDAQRLDGFKADQALNQGCIADCACAVHGL